jgi:hypothetical protein
MSLINEALKKAQRERTEEQADLNTLMPGGRPHAGKRPTSLSTQSMVLLGAGVVALFVVCVVATVIWINRPTPGKVAPAKPAIAKAPTETGSPVAIVVPMAGRAKTADSAIETAPVATAPKLTTHLTPAPVSAAPETAPPSMSSARSAPVSDLATTSRVESPQSSSRDLAPSFARAAEPVPAVAAPAVPSGKFDERIQTLVDGFRVAGIRASGSGSKVLLNEKVFKINDIVDRTNGLRLTEVANDRLTFTTADGVTYVKNF